MISLSYFSYLEYLKMCCFVPRCVSAHSRPTYKPSQYPSSNACCQHSCARTTIMLCLDQILTLLLTLTSCWISYMIISAYMHRTISCPWSVKPPPYSRLIVPPFYRSGFAVAEGAFKNISARDLRAHKSLQAIRRLR